MCTQNTRKKLKTKQLERQDKRKEKEMGPEIIRRPQSHPILPLQWRLGVLAKRIRTTGKEEEEKEE